MEEGLSMYRARKSMLNRAYRQTFLRNCKAQRMRSLSLLGGEGSNSKSDIWHPVTNLLHICCAYYIKLLIKLCYFILTTNTMKQV